MDGNSDAPDSAPDSFFSSEDLRDLDLASHLAADLVSEAYGLDFGDFRQWPVDIRHYPQLSEAEKRRDVLAQLLRYRRQDAVPTAGRPDFWRVCLYDPVILSTARRELLTLRPLLCYVLTHEFIHISRFIRFMELFGLDLDVRAKEEDIVHRQTAELLGRLALDDLAPVLSLFRDRHCPLDVVPLPP
jgi:hypothetical protein